MKHILLGLCLLGGLFLSGCQTTDTEAKAVIESYLMDYYTLGYDASLTDKEFLDQHLFMMSQNEASIASYEAYVQKLETYMTRECIEQAVPRRDLSYPTDLVLKHKRDLAVKSITFEPIVEDETFADYEVTVHLTLTSSTTSDDYEALLKPRVTVKKVDDVWKIKTFQTDGVTMKEIH